MTWRDSAACNGADHRIFFSEKAERSVYTAAITICNDCPVIEACLDYAVDNRLQHGVFGGKTPEERKRIRRRRPRALKPCGTTAAYDRHNQNREDPCPACRAAHREAQRRYRDNKRKAA